jgi:hypothetical protein
MKRVRLSWALLVVDLIDPEDLVDIVNELDLHSKDIIFLPINNNSSLMSSGGSHWYRYQFLFKLIISGVLYFLTKFLKHFGILIHLRERTHYEQRALLLDCLLYYSTNRHESVCMFSCVAEVLVHPKSPKQENGYDCGLYVIAFFDAVCSVCSASERSRVEDPAFWTKLTCESLDPGHVSGLRLRLRNVIERHRTP